jgi:hypothetical protein
MAIYTNYYRCEDCGVEWIDEWSCACDDECPECGKDFSPFDYEVEGEEDDDED